MTKPIRKINVDKKEAAIIYMLLVFVALFLVTNLYTKDRPDTGILILSGTYVIVVLPIAIYGITTLFNKRFLYKANVELAGDAQMKEPVITITDEEIVCSFPSTMRSDKIRWQDIVKIQVLITDEGPYVCDVFFVLLDSNDLGVVIPQDRQKESKTVLDRIVKFPGFDHQTFLHAMGHSEVKWFDVWKKK